MSNYFPSEKTITYKLCPTEDQIKFIEYTIDWCKCVANYLVVEKERILSEFKPWPNNSKRLFILTGLCKTLSLFKKKNPFLSWIHANALIATTYNLGYYIHSEEYWFISFGNLQIDYSNMLIKIPKIEKMIFKYIEWINLEHRNDDLSLYKIRSYNIRRANDWYMVDIKYI